MLQPWSRPMTQPKSPTKRTLGTCYYPEHWPEDIWEEDARQMAELGLTWVRIGEFSWSRLEPSEGQFNFEWLDRAFDTLHRHGLKVVLGTPTATPPKWVCNKYPDMFARDANGNLRKFGSRRHYCFSHLGYREQCRDIVTRLAERYGSHPALGAWQTDNEYGCHDTTLSYSDAARIGFQKWLANKYGNDISKLNAAWGNVFWSMEYAGYHEIDLPNLTVTEANPAHWLEFRRYTSDQVVAFNRLQCDIIREYSNAPISHNYMGRITDFDHFKVGADLDIATWDSYPIGFLADRAGATQEKQRRFMRQGDPDFQAFHHDLYRSVGKGRWWIMEQQPGPVNWAPVNPDPLPGMVRLWTWEAFAHGAETVAYFRWRQAPFAQEQMHAGILRTDSKKATAYFEATQVAEELAQSPNTDCEAADIAIIFDYDADFSWAALNHVKDGDYFELVFDHYRALRRLGLNIDILPASHTDFSHYQCIITPGLMHMDADLLSCLENSDALVIYGPTTHSRTETLSISNPLPPNLPNLDVTVARIDTPRGDMPIALSNGGHALRYREVLEGSAAPILTDQQGGAIAVQNGSTVYLGAYLDHETLIQFYEHLLKETNIETLQLPQGVRKRMTKTEEFWFNYDCETMDSPHGTLEPAGVLRVPRTP
jgi:beta-galactosidase